MIVVEVLVLVELTHPCVRIVEVGQQRLTVAVLGVDRVVVLLAVLLRDPLLQREVERRCIEVLAHVRLVPVTRRLAPRLVLLVLRLGLERKRIHNPSSLPRSPRDERPVDVPEHVLLTQEVLSHLALGHHRDTVTRDEDVQRFVVEFAEFVERRRSALFHDPEHHRTIDAELEQLRREFIHQLVTLRHRLFVESPTTEFVTLIVQLGAVVLRSRRGSRRGRTVLATEGGNGTACRSVVLGLDSFGHSHDPGGVPPLDNCHVVALQWPDIAVRPRSEHAPLGVVALMVVHPHLLRCSVRGQRRRRALSRDGRRRLVQLLRGSHLKTMAGGSRCYDGFPP